VDAVLDTVEQMTLMWDERRQLVIASASLMTRYAVSRGLDLDTVRNLAPAHYDRNAAKSDRHRSCTRPTRWPARRGSRARRPGKAGLDGSRPRGARHLLLTADGEVAAAGPARAAAHPRPADSPSLSYLPERTLLSPHRQATPRQRAERARPSPRPAPVPAPPP
jgi:hypothetical protein